MESKELTGYIAISGFALAACIIFSEFALIKLKGLLRELVLWYNDGVRLNCNDLYDLKEKILKLEHLPVLSAEVRGEELVLECLKRTHIFRIRNSVVYAEYPNREFGFMKFLNFLNVLQPGKK